MEFKGTKGNWSVPHLAVEDTSCNCGFVLSEGYCGSIATINYSKDGEHWSEGDNPPIEEAKYNAKLISCAPELSEALCELISLKKWKDEFGKDEWYLEKQPLAWINAQKVLEKALT